MWALRNGAVSAGIFTVGSGHDSTVQLGSTESNCIEQMFSAMPAA